MGRIKNLSRYALDTSISGNEYVIGSDADSNGRTRNYKISELASYIAEYIEVVISGGDRVISGFVFPLETPFTFASTPIEYSYGEQYFVAPARELITVSPPSLGNKRFDVFAVDIASNELIVKTGVESSGTPVLPEVDFPNEYLVTFVLLDENGVVDLYTEFVYEDNLGEPNEWTATADAQSGAVISLGSSEDPSSGSAASIKVTDSTLGSSITFENDATVEDTFSALLFQIKNIDVTGLRINITLLNSGLVVSSNNVQVFDGSYGYSISDTDGYQVIGIPFQEFNVTGRFDQIKFSLSSASLIGDSENFFIDKVNLIGGLEVPPQSDTWVSLADTDNTLNNRARYIPMVNSTEDKLELVNSNQFVQLSDLVVGNTVLDPRVIYLGTGLNYRILASRFIIDNVIYDEIVSTDVTLDPADASDPRIDVFAIEKVDSDTPAVGVVQTGTAQANPTEPTLDDHRAKCAIQLLPALATTPPSITSDDIFNEDAGTGGGEWDVTDTFGSVDENNSDITPSSGSVCILISPSRVSPTASIEFTDNTTKSFNPQNLLIFNIYLEAEWNDNVTMGITLQNSSSGLNGTTLSLNRTTFENYGLDSQLLEDWQTVAIPLSDLTIASNYDRVTFVMRNADGIFVSTYLDEIKIQDGLDNDVNPLRWALDAVLREGNVSTGEHAKIYLISTDKETIIVENQDDSNVGVQIGFFDETGQITLKSNQGDVTFQNRPRKISTWLHLQHTFKSI